VNCRISAACEGNLKPTRTIGFAKTDIHAALKAEAGDKITAANCERRTVNGER
jgi:hypothetical protein